MSSKPPPGYKPTQAGRFKPKLTTRPTNSTPKPVTVGTSLAAPPGSSNNNSTTISSTGRGGRDGANSGRSTGNSRGRGRGRGQGRDGRGRGRSSGRFVIPTGQVFFTGSSALDSSDGTSKGSKTKPPPTSQQQQQQQKSQPQSLESNTTTTEAVIFMPGVGASTTNGSGSGVAGAPVAVGNTAQERLAAASFARRGEGEEIIVGELDEGEGIGDGRTKQNALLGGGSSKRNDGLPSLFEDDQNNMEEEDDEMDVAAYTYDSDPSEDGEDDRMKDFFKASSSHPKRAGGASLQPQPVTLPYPPTKNTGSFEYNYLYDCQKPTSSIHNNKDDPNNTTKDQSSTLDTSIEEDPPFRSPFLNLNEATADEKKEEQLSWMLFKFPTRLPRLDATGTASLSNNRMIKTERNENDNENNDDIIMNDENDNGLDTNEVQIGAVDNINNNNTGSDSNNNNNGGNYDDTLKDIAAGKYGKIVIYKSGQAFLEIGGGVRMKLSEGLPFGFFQQAVSIDVDKGTYVPLGEVKKSLVLTPDVESAFYD
jgi:hypothetical protein